MKEVKLNIKLSTDIDDEIILNQFDGIINNIKSNICSYIMHDITIEECSSGFEEMSSFNKNLICFLSKNFILKSVFKYIKAINGLPINKFLSSNLDLITNGKDLYNNAVKIERNEDGIINTSDDVFNKLNIGGFWEDFYIELLKDREDYYMITDGEYNIHLASKVFHINNKDETNQFLNTVGNISFFSNLFYTQLLPFKCVIVRNEDKLFLKIVNSYDIFKFLERVHDRIPFGLLVRNLFFNSIYSSLYSIFNKNNSTTKKFFSYTKNKFFKDIDKSIVELKKNPEIFNGLIEQKMLLQALYLKLLNHIKEKGYTILDRKLGNPPLSVECENRLNFDLNENELNKLIEVLIKRTKSTIIDIYYYIMIFYSMSRLMSFRPKKYKLQTVYDMQNIFPLNNTTEIIKKNVIHSYTKIRFSKDNKIFSIINIYPNDINLNFSVNDFDKFKNANKEIVGLLYSFINKIYREFNLMPKYMDNCLIDDIKELDMDDINKKNFFRKYVSFIIYTIHPGFFSVSYYRETRMEECISMSMYSLIKYCIQHDYEIDNTIVKWLIETFATNINCHEILADIKSVLVNNHFERKYKDVYNNMVYSLLDSYEKSLFILQKSFIEYKDDILYIDDDFSFKDIRNEISNKKEKYPSLYTVLMKEIVTNKNLYWLK